MATINERTNGRFTAMVRRSGEKPQFRTFDTRKEAEDWATRIEGRILTKRDRLAAPNGASTTTAPPPADHTCTLTLAEALDWYERRYTGSKKGAKAERNRIAQWKRHPLASVVLDQISVDDIYEFIDDMMRPSGPNDLVIRPGERKRREPLAPSTVRNLLTIVSQVYAKVDRRNYEGLRGKLTNPVKGVELPKLGPARKRRLDKDENEYERLMAAARLLAAGEPERYGLFPAAIDLAIETGMRQGEMLKLTVGSIRTVGSRTFAFLEDTKNEDDRAVDLSSVARRAIAELLDRPKGTLLFDIPVSTFEKRWYDILDVARIVDLHWHDLRHEGVNRLYEKGLTTPEVMRMSGHKTLSALTRYTHARPSDDLSGKLG